MIYLDYAASSPPFPEVLERMNRTASDTFGNPGALHPAGTAARMLLQQSRIRLAGLLQVRAEELFFTSGGTESNNWAVKMCGNHPGKRQIVCSAMEHPSVMNAVKTMERNGFRVTWLTPDRDGRISPEQASAVIGPDTALLCVQAVNNETGVIQDVDALAAAAHQAGATYLCDAVQSFGHVNQNLNKADFITLSAHKLGGPRGVGCLVVRHPNRIEPLIHGGGQEFGLRSGTENLPGIDGFAAAAQLSVRHLSQETKRLESLTQQLQSGLRAMTDRLRIAGEQARRSPGILCCGFAGISGEEMVIRLAEQGICTSPGAACSARNSKPSHVLLSMGYTPEDAMEFFRFSLGRNTTEDEVHQTLDAISSIIL